MPEASPTTFEMLAAWVPMIVLIGAWVLVARYMSQSSKRQLAEAMRVNEQLLAINRKMLDEMREIKVALNDRKL